MTVIKSTWPAERLGRVRALRLGAYAVRRKCTQPEITSVAKELNVQISRRKGSSEEKSSLLIKGFLELETA